MGSAALAELHFRVFDKLSLVLLDQLTPMGVWSQVSDTAGWAAKNGKAAAGAAVSWIAGGQSLPGCCSCLSVRLANADHAVEHRWRSPQHHHRLQDMMGYRFRQLVHSCRVSSCSCLQGPESNRGSLLHRSMLERRKQQIKGHADHLFKRSTSVVTGHSQASGPGVWSRRLVQFTAQVKTNLSIAPASRLAPYQPRWRPGVSSFTWQCQAQHTPAHKRAEALFLSGRSCCKCVLS